MGSSALSLPPLPADSSSANSSGMSGAGQVSPSSGNSVSAFGGGMPAMMQAMQQIEAGAQALAQSLPSLAPTVAQFISQLRMAIPQAMSAGAASQTPGQGSGMAAPPPQQGQ